MRFILLVLVPVVVLLAGGLALWTLLGSRPKDPAFVLGALGLGVLGLIWLGAGIRVAVRYWRTRVPAKAWKDAQRKRGR